MPPFDELLAACTRSAVHLEMRDQYAVTDEAEDYAHGLQTGQRDTDPDSPYWSEWTELISATVARGVVVRRARIISEPASAYIRYEHASTTVNVQAGEQVRWLPRKQARNIAVPANDYWLFDGCLIRWGYFSGEGYSAGHEISEVAPS